MKKMLTLILTAAVTVCASGYLYLTLRYPQLEKRQMSIYEQHADKSYAPFARYFKSESLDVEGIQLIFKTMLKKDPQLDLVFGIDNYKNPVAKEHRKSATDSDFYASLTNKLTEIVEADKTIYYLFNQKLYVSRIDTDKCILIRVYPFALSQGAMFSLILECTLICSLAVVVVLSLVLFASTQIKPKQGRKTQSTAQKFAEPVIASENTIAEGTALMPEEKILETLESFVPDENVVKIENRRSAERKIRNFESFIFNLFYKLSITYKVRSLALYLFDSDTEELKKIYELFGSAFVKTPPQNSLDVENNKEILHALLEDSVIVRNSSRKIFLPLFSEEAFAGMLVIKNDSPVSGKVYRSIQLQSRGIGSYLAEELHRKAV